MKLLGNVRVIILILALILALVAINPRPWQEGVAVRYVEKDSAAALAGMTAPDQKASPISRERIVSINDVPINSEEDYYAYTSALKPNVTLRIETNRQTYILKTLPLLNVTTLSERERVNVTREVFNNETSTFENVTTTEWRNKTQTAVIGTEPLGLNVYNAPKTNIRYGLDISGGARVLLQPETRVTEEQMTMIIDTIKERLNVYGVSDIVVRPVSDLEGNQFILVEIAGASEGDVRELVQQQGKFEAKVGDQTVFSGGQDITYVCRSPECSGITPEGCRMDQDGFYFCQFHFSITLTPEAAQRQADVTRNLGQHTQPDGQQYLDKPLDLYLDDTLVNSLQISSGLRGSATTQISISGTGAGATERAAAEDTLANMKQLQTILVTGSLPVKLNVVKTDSISAQLGEEFIRNALFVGVLAFLTVTVVIILRYRRWMLSIPVIITLISEVLLILGLAALFRWSMDLAAIAGILIAIGTGVYDQIVIVDEMIGTRRKEEHTSTWKERIKKAFFVVFTAYFTALAAMLPLWWAGAGLVRGFAITSIIGITAGVLITRPAFAVFMEKLEKEE